MKRIASILLLAIVTIAICSFKKKEKLADGLYAEMITNKGTILLWLEYEKMPLTVSNFVGLAEGKIPNTFRKPGKPFYDSLTFHRVIANFMIQGGDPAGNGTGGPGYKFKQEIVSELKHAGPGILAMANAGPNTNGSQFYITHNTTAWLDGAYNVFGHVVKGQDVVNSIAIGDRIITVKIIRKGKKAKKFKADKVFEDLSKK
jgi:cyclophilin family peptidyl-prolyl cis-trans isomerase